MTEKGVFVESAGEKYRLQTLEDFRFFRQFALSESEWTKHYSDSLVTVESRPPTKGSGGLNIVRVRREMRGIRCVDLYDNLHDAKYREVWDENMIEGFNIVKLNPHNDIGYYSAKFPWPLTNRDFCNMRSWMEFSNGEFIIFNHSVTHSDCPVKKDFIRAQSILTGYLIQPLGENGCLLVYVSHSDPCGSIPHSIINMTTKRLVPKVMNKLEQSTMNYSEFASKNHTVARDALPWRTPKMDWNSLYNFPHENIEAKKSLKNSLCGHADENRNCETHEGVANVSNGRLPQFPVVFSEVRTTDCLSLAPVAPNYSDDTVAIQQYRAIMQDSINTVDRTFLHEGKVPMLTDYLTRLAFIVDGIRQTAPQ